MRSKLIRHKFRSIWRAFKRKQEDETEYLLKSPANRERLLKAIDNVANNCNLVTVDMDDLE